MNNNPKNLSIIEVISLIIEVISLIIEVFFEYINMLRYQPVNMLINNFNNRKNNFNNRRNNFNNRKIFWVIIQVCNKPKSGLNPCLLVFYFGHFVYIFYVSLRILGILYTFLNGISYIYLIISWILMLKRWKLGDYIEL